MPRTGFELAISTFERLKTVLALDRSAIETGMPFTAGRNIVLAEIINSRDTTQQVTHSISVTARM
jgi:hypothetical protein